MAISACSPACSVGRDVFKSHHCRRAGEGSNDACECCVRSHENPFCHCDPLKDKSKLFKAPVGPQTVRGGEFDRTPLQRTRIDAIFNQCLPLRPVCIGEHLWQQGRSAYDIDAVDALTSH